MRASDRAPKAPREFVEFVRQLDLLEVVLRSAKVENLTPDGVPHSLEFRVRTTARYENRDDGFDMYHQYSLGAKDLERKQSAARISVTYRVRYRSRQEMDDESFESFHRYSLPLTTWPYFREFVHSSLSRMNWTGVVVPALKSGVFRGTGR
jgi:hypothetical protein